MIRKGQVRWLDKGELIGQRQFIHNLRRIRTTHSSACRRSAICNRTACLNLGGCGCGGNLQQYCCRRKECGYARIQRARKVCFVERKSDLARRTDRNTGRFAGDAAALAVGEQMNAKFVNQPFTHPETSTVLDCQRVAPERDLNGGRAAENRSYLRPPAVAPP